MIVSTLFISIISILIDHALLTRKKSIPFCLATFVTTQSLMFIIALLFNLYIPNLIILKYTYYLIAFTASLSYMILVFRESLSKKIFTLFSVWMFSTIALFFATLVAGMSLGFVKESHIPTVIYLIRLLLMSLLLLAIYLGLNKPYKNAIGIVSDTTMAFMLLYPMIAFLFLINSYGATIGSFKNFDSFHDILLFVVFVMIGYILVFVGIISSSKIITLQYNYKIIENQVELQRHNYKTLSESIEKLHALKHDVRHHISAIKSMLEEKKYNQALEYIEQFNQNSIVKSMPTLCQNFAADSITKYYMSIAISKDIEFKTSLDIPEDININSLDLCVVLGNCLENAIEACEKLDVNVRKYIEFTSQIVNSHIILKIVNSFDGPIIKTADSIQSTKKEHSNGIGITSVIETAKKYKGTFDIRYTNDEFEVAAIMNISLTRNNI